MAVESTVPVQSIAEQLLVEVKREKEENGSLSDDLISALRYDIMEFEARGTLPLKV